MAILRRLAPGDAARECLRKRRRAARRADILDPWENPTCSGPHLLPENPTPDFPGETFRVLKENETRKFGEYRTRRLLLKAWARLEAELGPVRAVDYRGLVGEWDPGCPKG